MRYDPKKIEQKWTKEWEKDGIYEPDFKKAKRPFYNLMMFPYPSAEGLHVGNMYAFVGADIYGRKKRMEGHDVFEPIGLDGFGIHSENYALNIDAHPMKLAEKSEKNFYKQLQMIGNGFAWNEKLETYDPEYYRWTQWIFVQMFKRGLAYRKKAKVNWCAKCATVLADEQVISGDCERCETAVIKKELEQWFFKITQYAKRLLDDLENIDWSEKVKIAQKNWIGEHEGAEIEFSVVGSNEKIKVFTTRPDTLFGATYMAISPESELILNLKSKILNLKEVEEYIAKAQGKTDEERMIEEKNPSTGSTSSLQASSRQAKTGVELKGVKVINPANDEEIPVWVADYVLGDVGTGAVMAVPAHDQRDFEFAKKHALPAIMVVCPHYPARTCPVLDEAYAGEGHMVASGEFNGMESENAKWEIVRKVGGKRKTTYRLRDWLISRQRYWGPPIPMIFCAACEADKKGERDDMPGWYAVAEKDLPVKLPYVKDFKPTGDETAPLAAVKKFYKTTCPKCGGEAKRETDVSDTFLDSAWYYIGYVTKIKNSKLKIQNSPFSDLVRKWCPVHMYIGGAEHAVLHLLYTRFLAKVFHDWGFIDFNEPFVKFRAHGLLIKDGAKMSKSRGNVINPDIYIQAYGIDAFRMYLMFLGPFEQGGDFRGEGIKGITRFLERVWRIVQATSNPPSPRLRRAGKNQESRTENKIEKFLHQTIKKVTEDIDSLNYNTAISQLMIVLREFENNPDAVSNDDIKILLQLAAPFAPFLTEHLWHETGEKKSIHVSGWPAYDEEKTKEDIFELVIQINGKVRDTFQASVTITKEEMEQQSLARPRIQKLMEGKKPKKIIIIPKRLINIVL